MVFDAFGEGHTTGRLAAYRYRPVGGSTDELSSRAIQRRSVTSY